ncbi:MAG: hypothetical protein CME64_02760 [Halobacteriovoraceae bacterium]|nr:hypothetical protein [Halobacteriovoraceae bacterium]
MKSFLFITLFIFSNLVFSQSNDTKEILQEIYSSYEKGEYEEAISLLANVSKNFENHSKNHENLKGLINYWQGLCYVRLNEFEKGIDKLRLAIKENYAASDVYYEYGQALYASLELKKARIAFKKSVEAKYKMAVSMYYIGFISQEIGDLKTAASFYNAIEKLPLDEKKDVVQAARMQLAQIYLDQVREKGMGAVAIEEYVLPMYRKALKWDEESSLAVEIKAKIESIQRRYNLVLFQLRNGRPTARPAYFLKTNIKYSIDDNVNAYDKDTLETLKEEEYSSSLYEVGAFGRYTFYPNSSFSLSPQFNFGYTKYLSEESAITRNDNYFFTGTLQTTYEHFFNEAPATTYLDIGYTYNADDIDEDESLEKSDTVASVTLSEQLQIWKNNPSTFRLRYAQTNAEDANNELSSYGVVYEQAIAALNSLFYLYTAYDKNTYAERTSEDNVSTTIRLDALMPDVYNLFNPNLYASTFSVDYENDAERGTTTLNTIGLNLNRPVGKNWFLYVDYAVSSQTGNNDTDNYEKQVVTVNLDYIF